MDAQVPMAQGCSQTFIWVGSFSRKSGPFLRPSLYGLHYGVRKLGGSGGMPPQEIF